MSIKNGPQPPDEQDGVGSLVPSIRAINRARVVSLIRRHPGLTRTELSQRSGLSKSTVSNSATELLHEGFLHEDPTTKNRRRNTRLWLNKDAGYAIGIEFSPDECRAILTNMAMETLRRTCRPLISARVEASIETILDVTSELMSGIAGRLLGLVVAVPGPTDPTGQQVVFSESLGWSDVPLAARLAERLPCRVMVINRPQAAVLGEYWYGAGTGIDNLLYASITNGVGLGIIIGGRLYSGASGCSGEFGHTTMLLDGPLCVCGNRGCLEAIVSVPAIMHAVQARLEKGETSSLHDASSYQALIAAARDGDFVVLDEIKKASRFIGVGIANLIGLFNPARVIIGGRLPEVGAVVLNTVRESAQRRAFPLNLSNVSIVQSALGLDSACIGACSLVVEQYLASIGPVLPPQSQAQEEGLWSTIR